MIEVPPKIWRPKMVSKYTTPDYADNDLDDILDYGKFGRCVYRSDIKWDSGVRRMDRILFDEKEHAKELDKDLKLGPSICDQSKQDVVAVIKNTGIVLLLWGQRELYWVMSLGSIPVGLNQYVAGSHLMAHMNPR